MRSYLLFPVGPGDLNNKIFDSPYDWLRQVLAERGIDLQTSDRRSLRQAEKVLVFNHQPAAYAACRQAGLKPEQLVLFLMEPRPVMPEQYSQKVWGQYGTIFSFLDNLVDGKKFFKMYYPQGHALPTTVPGWYGRKFLTLINANKYSYVANELYSLRRKAIRYFDQRPDFDLYGRGWATNGAVQAGVAGQALRQRRGWTYLRDLSAGWHRSPSDRGPVTDKYEILGRYKFCLTFENEEHTQGYITEKLFDCFFTGTIPIYLGADNVAKYVPAECLIDFRKFTGFAELEKYLRAMTESEFSRYQRHGQDFLHSQAFAPWQPQNVFASIADHL